MLLEYNEKNGVLTASFSEAHTSELKGLEQIANFIEGNKISNVVLIFNFAITHAYVLDYVVSLNGKIIAIGKIPHDKPVCCWVKEGLPEHVYDHVMKIFNE